MPLAYYSRAATSEFWSEHWGGHIVGDVATVSRLPRTELARYQAEVGFDLVRVAEALGVIEGRDEGGGGDRADAGDGAQPLDARIVGREMLDGVVGVRELGVAASSYLWCSLSDISRLDIPARCGEHAGIMCTRTQEQPAWLDT